ncbi:MAG: carbohydrate ABC transporter permease [Bullifex sp.]
MEKSRAILSGRQKFGRGIISVLTILFSCMMLYPIVYIILGSFKENQELLLGGAKLLPTKWVIDNYIQAWQTANFSVYTKNSVFLGVGVMILTVITATMAGYVFSRKQFRGKEFVYGIFMAFMFVNVGSVTLRPLFELAVKLHLNKSLWSVIFIITGTGQATYIFLCRGFVNSIPRELDEAARIDGCTFFQTFYKIVFPLLKPITSTVALLSFRAGWNEYILPLVFTMSNDKMRPLTVGVNMLKNNGDGAAAWNIMFAGATLAIIPMIVIYLMFSKYFMQGTTAGAVKG